MLCAVLFLRTYELVVGQGHCCLHERRIDAAAQPCSFAAQERRTDPEGERHCAHVVCAHRIPRRRAVVDDASVGGHQAAARLDDDVHACVAGIGTRCAERRHGADDQAREPLN